MTQGRSHWGAYHARWSRLRPPLRPTPDVVTALREEAERVLASAPHRTCLVLGVTPELARLHTPLLAVDRNPSMIEALWPGDEPGRRALCADWTRLELAAGTVGFAVGDGSLNVMPHPHPQIQVLERLRELMPEAMGGAALRCFVRPSRTETTREVAATPERSQTFHAFKWRLAMAVCAERGVSLRVAELREELLRRLPDLPALARRTGWPLEDVQTIHVYENSPETYSFPSQDEFLEVARAAGWEGRFRAVVGYELAERCPLLVLS
ncbi:MAG: hypothetical protein KC766_19340 [Myxococcales bacterium]|nr:hypothetical protein [Myxococcales bacterium]